LTIRDLLKRRAFRRADFEVLACEDGLDAAVRWLHIVHIENFLYAARTSSKPVMPRWLKGGELVISTGVTASHRPAALIRYLRELKEAGAAGLALEPWPLSLKIDEKVIQEARNVELPLLILRRDIPMIEVSEDAFAAIVNHQYDLLRKAESIGFEFFRLLRHEVSIGRILSVLEAIAGNPVVLENEAHQIVEFAPRSAGAPLLEAWETHARCSHDERDGVATSSATPPCIWIPVFRRNEPSGRLHILELESPLDEIDSLALERAAAAVSLALVGSDDEDTNGGARAGIIEDVLSELVDTPDEFLARARSHGVVLDGRTIVALSIELRGLADFLADRGAPDVTRRVVMQRLFDAVRSTIANAELPAVPSIVGERVLVLVGLLPRVAPREVVNSIAESIQGRLEPSLWRLDCVVGARVDVDLRFLRRALLEAQHGAHYARLINGPAGAYCYDDLGVHKLFLHLADGPDLAAFVEAELQALLEHDATRNTKLLPTLQAYLDAGGNKSIAARSLHIERRSLYHRLDKISQLLGRDPDEPETRARLVIALKGLELFSHRRHIGSADRRTRGSKPR
jgi:purine catabolism regulator